MTRIKDVVDYIETIAPKSLQESYDNAGLIVGNINNKLTGITISLDITEDVIEEAIQNGDNLIISHHPIIFKGLKKLTGSNYVERCVMLAIKNEIALFSAHTNLDNVIKQGVNDYFAQKIGLTNTRILVPKQNQIKKLTTYIPNENVEEVMSALHKAGGGNIGEYNGCSFRVEGTGHFTPSENANPTIGINNISESVNETRIELVFPSYLEGKIVSKLKIAHPYEEVAYDVVETTNFNQEIGSGMIGELENENDSLNFLKDIKDKFDLKVIKHTKLTTSKIKKVAICGGSGSFLLGAAKANKADIFITGDFKYHEFFDAENDIIIADIGHYESEIHTKDLFFDIIRKKFSNIALNFAKTNTNPVNYLV